MCIYIGILYFIRRVCAYSVYESLRSSDKEWPGVEYAMCAYIFLKFNDLPAYVNKRYSYIDVVYSIIHL